MDNETKFPETISEDPSRAFREGMGFRKTQVSALLEDFKDSVQAETYITKADLLTMVDGLITRFNKL